MRRLPQSLSGPGHHSIVPSYEQTLPWQQANGSGASEVFGRWQICQPAAAHCDATFVALHAFAVDTARTCPGGMCHCAATSGSRASAGCCSRPPSAAQCMCLCPTHEKTSKKRVPQNSKQLLMQAWCQKRRAHLASSTGSFSCAAPTAAAVAGTSLVTACSTAFSLPAFFTMVLWPAMPVTPRT